MRTERENIERSITDEINRESERVNQVNSIRNTRMDKTHSRLLVAVRWVYIIMFFICLIIAFISASIQDEIGDDINKILEGNEDIKKPSPNVNKIQSEPLPAQSQAGFTQGHHMTAQNGIDMDKLVSIIETKINDKLGDKLGQIHKKAVNTQFTKDSAAKMRKRKMSKKQQREIQARKLRQSGLTPQEIAENLGVSTRTVDRYLKV